MFCCDTFLTHTAQDLVHESYRAKLTLPIRDSYSRFVSHMTLYNVMFMKRTVSRSYMTTAEEDSTVSLLYVDAMNNFDRSQARNHSQMVCTCCGSR